MANKLFHLPGNRLFNNSNIASPGGTATLYLSGTTTLANFLDSDGVSLGPSLTANGLGQLPGAYGDETLPYRLILRDSSGVQIDGGDIDPFYFGLVPGVDGTPASVQIGTVSTGAAGASAAVSNSGTAQDAVLDFTIPSGAQGPAGDVAKVTNRAGLSDIAGATAGMARLLTESGREGTFAFDSSDLSAEVAADTAQGIYVAPSSDATGASGAWVRKLDGPLIASWFGVTADGVTDDYTALSAALSLADTLGLRHVRLGKGTHLVGTSIAVPSDMIIEGHGRSTEVKRTGTGDGNACVFYTTGASHFTVRDMKLTPTTGATLRTAAVLVSCSHAKFENIVVDDITDSSGIYLFDCDWCVVDNLYFDGSAATKAGNGVVASGCQNCKIVNSHAINCFAGFVFSGYDIDSDINPLGVAARPTDESFGNVCANSTVRNCTTQSFNANSSRNNVFSNCHAADYAGASTHKAFQAKDPGTGPDSGTGTRGNVFIGCTVENYPGGFGGQLGADTQIIGCSAKDISNRFIDLNGVTAPIVEGCSVDGFAVAGIWLGAGTVRGKFDNITLETSTATATGIQLAADGNNGSNNFDNITTSSTLAKFIDIASTCTNNRFGPGCRSNSQAISDASNSSTWPMIFRTDTMDLTASGSLQFGPYLKKQIQVVRATFIVTTAITGSPQVSAGVFNSNTAYSAATAVTGGAGGAVALTVTNQVSATANILQGRVAAAGTAGKGFLQFEGLPLL